MAYTGKKPTDVIDATTAQTLTIEDNIVTPSINSGQIGGRRNLIINGAMNVAQRGTSFSSNANIYTLDRMRRAGSSLATAVFDVEQSTDSPDGFSYSYKVTTSTVEGSVGAGDISYGLVHKIEAQDLQHLGYSTSSAKSVTVSFYVKSNTTGTYVLNLYNADNNRQIGKTYTISSANTWEYKTLTFVGDTTDGFNNDSGSGLELYFMTGAGTDWTSGTLPATWEDYAAGVTQANFAAGQNVQLQNTLNATWQITGLQLEVGSVATEFEHQRYCDVYKDCQRYYYKSGDNAASGNEWFPGVATNANRGYYYALALESVIDRAYPALQWPVQMRAAPSVTFYPGRSGVTNTADRITLYNADTLVTFTQSPFPYSNGITDIFLGTSTDSSAYSYQVIADAEL